VTRKLVILAAEDVAHRMVAAGLVPATTAWRQLPSAVICSLPEWAAEAGLAEGLTGYWLWIGPGESHEEPAGQVMLQIPEGRYLVEVIDISTGQVIARELAFGPPLVVGAPWRPTPVGLHIRPVTQ
jgi:hypothetical protein